MRLLHSLAKTHASFGDPDLVSHAWLVPVMALAQRAGSAIWSRSMSGPAASAGSTRTRRSGAWWPGFLVELARRAPLLPGPGKLLAQKAGPETAYRNQPADEAL